MNQLRLDKRDIMLNEQDSCLDRMIVLQALCDAYVDAEKAVEGKELKRWLLEVGKDLQAEMEHWGKVMQKLPCIEK